MNMIKNFLKNIIKFPRKVKKILFLISDLLIIMISLCLAFYLRLDDPLIYIINDYWLFIVLPLLTAPFLIYIRLYRAVLQHIGPKTIIAILKSITYSAIILGFLMMVVREVSLPRSIFFIYWFIAVVLLSAVRYLAHWLLYSFPIKRSSMISVAIYGAGEAGAKLAKSMNNSSQYTFKLFIDDDTKKVGTIIDSCEIYSSSHIKKIIEDKKIDMILLAIPSLNKSDRKKILTYLSKFPIKVMELPSVENIIDGRVTVDDIKKVEVEDILGRLPIKPIQSLLSKNIKNKNILITGAGGSIGSELCRQILLLNPSLIVLYEMSEYNLYSIHKELNSFKRECVKIIPVLGSVNHKSKVNIVLNEYKIHTVYHAAAYKHVPMVEINPFSGVYNNILGTFNMVEQSIANNVETFILISTDKAVRPTNVMGASKRFSELILQGFDGTSSTILSMVRFGNVLDSAGSVLPLFRKQINDGGPLTVTHKDIIRYFMSIPESVQLVIQAGAMAKGGEVFILDMGDPINILDMAKKMIYLSGLIPKDEDNPNGDISIEFTGLRPGEKLYEELLIGDNPKGTKHPRIMKTQEQSISLDQILEGIKDIKVACKKQDIAILRKVLINYIEDYKPSFK